jgi:hypothetical protein
MNLRLKFLAALALSVSLVAAPCKNCQPKSSADQAEQCQHDCCPKPKPEKPACKWQPADYAAVETKHEIQAAPEFALGSIEAISIPLPASAPAASPQVKAEPPPLYLALHQLRN